MEDSEEYGPALPPGMIAGGGSSQKSEGSSSRSKVLGPSVPGHLRKSSDSDDLSDEGQLMVKMESDLSPEQGDSTVGPIPSEMASEGDNAAKTADEFEKRAKRMKDKLSIKTEAGDASVKREEWMTELPPEMGKNFGLQNRQFATGKGSGDAGEDGKDRSAWTDTPSMKKEKDSKGKKRKREEEKLSSRDQKLHQQVEDYNKSKRSESLVDLHSKKQKKKKKKEKKEKDKEKKKKKEKGEKEEKKEERIPFDREKDLKTNEIDEAQRKAIIRKSAVLNTRFSFGERTSHFL